jgi:hypothetical protein
MTHIVRSGETLSGIASANGITLAQLLDANPQFKANPNLIRVGDILNLPNGQAPPPVQPPRTPPPQPQPTAGRVLGKLSERFEVGRRGPGTVSSGGGDPGGVSYGSFQMTSKPRGGRVKEFVSQQNFPFRDRFRNLTPGSEAFSNEWRRIARAQREEFQKLQHDFIKRTHFDPLVRMIIRQDGLNVLTRSFTLQDVVWSTAVHHGPGNNVVHRALGTLGVRAGSADFDRSLIIAIYAERGRKDSNGVLTRFRRSPASFQRSIARRFVEEQRDALAMLARELSR